MKSINPTNKKLLIVGPLMVFFSIPLIMAGFCIERCTTSPDNTVANILGLIMAAIGLGMSVFAILWIIYRTRLPKPVFWGILVPGLLLWLVLFFVRRQ